ncbi:MAG: hypothetical protein PG979_000774 [Rickettsia asembonensis]|nr:MAG: hypothetical protein PG979_000774 [Rickettsia asembonensis]
MDDKKDNRHLSKPAYREEFKGDTSARTAAYTLVREDDSTGSTSKLPLEAKFVKMSNNISKEENIQLNSQSFRQDEFKSKSTERTYVREYRLNSKNSPVSNFVNDAIPKEKEIGGVKGLEPTRYGDWQHKGKVTDF